MKDLTKLSVTALEDLKAFDIRVLDVREYITMIDTMIIASGRSNRQISAIAEHVVAIAKQANIQPYGVEGLSTDSGWVLVDLGTVVIHVMHPDAREYYQLEKLWIDR